MKPRTGAGTHTGQPSKTPTGQYDVSPRHEPSTASAPADAASTTSVQFIGDDGRTRTFSADKWPMPGWHGPALDAFARRTGPTGTLRTEASARSIWLLLSSFLRYLDLVPDSPAVPSALHAAACPGVSPAASICGQYQPIAGVPDNFAASIDRTSVARDDRPRHPRCSGTFGSEVQKAECVRILGWRIHANPRRCTR